MKNYKIRYQFIYNGELVVQGNSYNDAAKLGQETDFVNCFGINMSKDEK